MAIHSPRKHESGLTLPELLATLSVAMVMVVGTAEFLPPTVDNTRLVTAVNGFVGALHLARSEAIRRGRTVVLCPRRDDMSCGNSSDWRNGWMLFASDNREREAHEPVLRAGMPLVHGVAMHSGNRRKRIVYQPDGSSGGSNSSFTFCGRHPRTAPRVICLSNSGRARLSRTRCDGKPVVCP